MFKNDQNFSSGLGWITGIVLVIIGFVVWASLSPESSPVVSNNRESLAGIQSGNAPWLPELSRLRERLRAIGLPALTREGTALHIHQHVEIFIDGKPVEVPASIGIDRANGFISDIHTHEADAVIHIEAPKIRTFTLGQFFDVWGVVFTSQRIGGYIQQGEKMLKVFVNGKLYSGDFRQLVLESHQEIVVAYGTEKELPNPIPSKYIFSEGD